MSEAILTQPPVTISEFDAFLDGQQDDRSWELVAGRIVAMTNPTEVHEQIASNIGAPLKLAMDPKGCRVYQGGIGIQRSDNEQGIDRPRPDVLVRCGRLGTRNFVTDPLVVVEVLSPSTMDVDRGDKLRFYKALPTLRHIVLVYQDQMRVEHYRKTDIGWELESLTQPDEFLRFEAVTFEIALEHVYFGVELNNIRRLSAR
ncbi:MAG TPA: Uma2 family endonuclease [Acetobacteraceae bacterium]|nr:Uma2 family endonuclease [Acetobacteraceae bacterium]